MSDEISLLDLPKAIIIKIIGKDIDRKNLRATCRAMEQVVSECDLQATPCMRMLSKVRLQQAYYNKGKKRGKGQLYRETVICRRLFRSAHFEHIEINQYCFKLDEKRNHPSISDCIKQREFITCEALEIIVGDENYDSSMSELIDNITPHKKVYLNIRTPRYVDENLFANISSVPHFFVKWNWYDWTYESAPGELLLKISDPLVLLLARKHRSLEFECSVEGAKLCLEPSTIMELAMIVITQGHSFKAPLAWYTLEESLEWLGVNIVDMNLESEDPLVNVSSTTRYPYGRRKNGDVEYTIQKGELMITVKNFLNESLNGPNLSAFIVEMKKITN